MRQEDPELQLKRRRMVQVLAWLSLIIQVVILLAYYFKEKQVILTFPMIIGIMVTCFLIWHQQKVLK